MESKNKMLIPLIIVFFIFGVIVGYVAHKPVTIEKIVEKTVTVTVTPAPITTPAPTLTPTPTQEATPTVSDFTIKNSYDPAVDTPTYTIHLRNWRADPNDLSVRLGDSVLIKITNNMESYRMTLLFNSSYIKDLGTSGFAYFTFNKKGLYNFKVIIPSDDPNVIPQTYAEGKINVY